MNGDGLAVRWYDGNSDDTSVMDESNVIVKVGSKDGALEGTAEGVADADDAAKIGVMITAVIQVVENFIAMYVL